MTPARVCTLPYGIPSRLLVTWTPLDLYEIRDHRRPVLHRALRLIGFCAAIRLSLLLGVSCSQTLWHDPLVNLPIELVCFGTELAFLIAGARTSFCQTDMSVNAVFAPTTSLRVARPSSDFLSQDMEDGWGDVSVFETATLLQAVSLEVEHSAQVLASGASFEGSTLHFCRHSQWRVDAMTGGIDRNLISLCRRSISKSRGALVQSPGWNRWFLMSVWGDDRNTSIVLEVPVCLPLCDVSGAQYCTL